MSASTDTVTVRFTTPAETVGDTRLVRLPADASRALPSRGQVAVTGSLDGEPFATVVEPDGRRGHWVRLDPGSAAPGDTVELELVVAEEWPEPDVPEDLAEALAAAPEHIREVWDDITPMARWEWVRWVGATRSPETRAKRVGVSIDKIDHGKRRPCCFDLSSCTDPDVARGGKLPEPS
ncbi:YdeI/OmpD-associated family protein [Phycicoccus sp.]|uniref:YdeI/OmpD-associated family protein n=1 Tax=Phycicoccus sp. TaxID=1902410 RepID=UPI002C46DA7B|nr:YdeI/OmpD-associated family protein [Phycicoccus sp.]HMM94350.1 YdeI/OmpD-associated family protein [Phycicoccus sp.]